jgi:hypothetical protein
MRSLLVLIVLGFASCEPSQSRCAELCDPSTEFCVVTIGCRFLQNGNPNPFGEADRYRCAPIPDRCANEQTCDCVTCADDPDATDCFRLGGCGEASIDAPMTFTFGCE